MSHRIEPRIAAELTKLSVNLVHAFIATILCRVLIDSGSTVNVLSGDIYRRMRETLYMVRPQRRHATLLSADSTSMKVLCDIDVNIKLVD